MTGKGYWEDTGQRKGYHEDSVQKSKETGMNGELDIIGTQKALTGLSC